MTTDTPSGHEQTNPHVPATHRRRRLVQVLAAAVAVLGILAVGFALDRPTSQGTDEAAEAQPTRLESAKQECAEYDDDVRLGDGGSSLTISRVAAEEAEGANFDDLVCVLLHIDVPDAVISQMDGTRALDGRQDASWDGFTASWTYHPDDGINMILQEGD